MSYDQEFAQAMALKLRLSREQKPSPGSEASAKGSVPSDQLGETSLRRSIAQQVTQDNPGLTESRVLEMMERDGF